MESGSLRQVVPGTDPAPPDGIAAPGRVARKVSRIPSLDGLRALAIGTVILLHLSERYSGTRLGQVLLMGTFDGVGLFFVLSGFLITTLLLRECERTGRLALGDFYLRRAFRILPPLYVYLAFAACFAAVWHAELPWHRLLGAVLFWGNYDTGASSWMVEHTWSLCVEEQFYLLWPPVLLLVLRRYGWPGGRIPAAWLAGGLIAVTPVIRVGMRLMHGAAAHGQSGYLFTRMDGLMTGCLLALLVGEPWFERLFARAARWWWLGPVFFYVISGVLTLRFGTLYRNTLGYTLDALTMGWFLLWASRYPESWIGRVLNARPVVVVGVLSYSAYLWQTFFIHRGNTSPLGRMPWALAGIALAAGLSYLVVERPALALRRRLERRSRMELLPEPEPPAAIG